MFRWAFCLLELSGCSSSSSSSIIPKSRLGSMLSSTPSDAKLCYCYRQSLGAYSSIVQPERMAGGGLTCGVLLNKLETAVKNHQLDQAWGALSDYQKLYGHPDRSLLRKFISALSYSCEPRWLRKASDLVLVLLKGKPGMPELESLSKVTVSLARAQMPVPACQILRLMLQQMFLPPMSVLSLIFLHMVKSDVGSFLASNFLVEICDTYLSLTPDQSNCVRLLKPETLIFNLVLSACVRYGLPLKGQHIMECMARVGVVADAHSIILIARIHEMNGQRDEIKKFKGHVDRVYVSYACNYCQFYDSLLSLHFKFGDLDAVAELTLDLCRSPEAPHARHNMKDANKTCHVPIGSQYLKKGLKLEIAPDVLQKDSVLNVETKQDLVVFKSGRISLTNRALAKLIILFKCNERVAELSKLILALQKHVCSPEKAILCCAVIGACVCVGWLETAHDILDEMELERMSMGYITCKSLLTAYCKEQMFKQAHVLLKQMRKAGFVITMSNETFISKCLTEVEEGGGTACNIVPVSKSDADDLTSCLLWEMQECHTNLPPTVYQLNSSIYFFCKTKMIEDALKTYRGMKAAKTSPTLQTYANLVSGYSSWEMYREITILWVDIKRSLASGDLAASRDLFEFLLLNFLIGGYFERVMEVINYMKEHGMYTDKGLYRNQFLKLHKNLYRKLKASKATSEAQTKRLEFVRAFRKWVGIG